MTSTVLMLLSFIFGASYGNLQGDQLTLKDCAISGRAIMKGGGEITCAVVKK